MAGPARSRRRRWPKTSAWTPSWNAWCSPPAGLLHARYGALGVIGDDRALSHFITVGIDERTCPQDRRAADRPRRPWPADHRPRPLRLHDLASIRRPSDSPAHHPPMQSFLGVPVRVRDAVFGNLYLTEKEGGGDFTDEDEGARRRAGRRRGRRDRERQAVRRLPPAGPLAGSVHGCVRADARQRPRLFLGRPRSDRRPGRCRSPTRQLALIVAPAVSGAGYIVAGAAGERAKDFTGTSLCLDSPAAAGCPRRRRAGHVRSRRRGVRRDRRRRPRAAARGGTAVRRAPTTACCCWPATRSRCATPAPTSKWAPSSARTWPSPWSWPGYTGSARNCWSSRTGTGSPGTCTTS